MITRAKLLSVAQVSAYLAQALGTSRQWVDTLNDHRRDKGDLKGVLLLPFGRKRGASGKALTPVYDPAAVVQFVKDVRIAYRSEKPFSSGIETFNFHDIPMLHKDHWHHRIVTPLPTTSRSA